MAIESKVSGTPPQEGKRDYPYLGRHANGVVVLFNSESFGTYVQGDEKEIGYISDTWQEDQFTPLAPSETITLSNK